MPQAPVDGDNALVAWLETQDQDARRPRPDANSTALAVENHAGIEEAFESLADRDELADLFRNVVGHRKQRLNIHAKAL